MNCKLEKFWNEEAEFIEMIAIPMNCKLEKFWNNNKELNNNNLNKMNCKLEKFWNGARSLILVTSYIWTVNLKSFEI